MPTEIQGVPYFTHTEIADQMGVRRETLWRWRREGKVPQGSKFRGKQVLFTEAEVAEAAAPESWTPSPLTMWVVHKGEHLWGISGHGKVYGDPYQWPLLFKRNRHQIEDADLIYPGQVLHIERDLSNAEIDRAIEHAKTRGAWILGITELTDLEYLSRERGYE